MDDIESSVVDIQRLLRERAGTICPAIFPSQRVPRGLFDLISQEDKESMEKWLESAQINVASIGFKTEFDYKKRVISVEPILCTDDIDQRLCSLEKLMDIMVSRNDQALLGLLSERFREWNASSDADEALYEVCNLAYSLKIIISNIPGVTIMLGDSAVPLPPGNNKFDKIFASLKRKPTTKRTIDASATKRSGPGGSSAPKARAAPAIGAGDSSSSSSSDEEEEVGETERADAGKRRKKRRGKK